MIQTGLLQFNIRSLACALVTIGLLQVPLATAAENPLDNTCTLRLRTSSDRLLAGEISDDHLDDFVIKLIAGKGYVVQGTASYRNYYDYDNPAFYLMVDLTFSHNTYREDYSINLYVKLDVTRSTSTDTSSALFYKANEGSFTCRQWTGFSEHYEDLRDHPIVGLPLDTLSALNDWNNRCGQDETGKDLDPLSYGRNRVTATLKMHLAALPTCQEAKALKAAKK